jgi:hypothetical protein
MAVEVICVLRDEELELSELLELDERAVGCVGFNLARWNPPPWRRQAGVAPRPHAVRAAKVRDAGVGADASAREGDEVLALDDPPSDCADVLFKDLFVVHGIRPKVISLLLHWSASLSFSCARSASTARSTPSALPQRPMVC